MTSSKDSTQETWIAAIRYITGRKAAEEALGFLTHISSLLDAEQEPVEWGRSVARACVPYLGSAVSVDIAGVRDPVLEPDERFEPALRQLRAAASYNGEAASVISDHPKMASIARAAPAEDVPATLFGSAAVVRLVFRSHASGYLAVLRTPEHPKGAIGPADLALISELASRLALSNTFTELAARASTAGR
ncbi:MAG: hypothetical protein ACRDQX_15685 [Pseudonocardiaceae bacterium]